jgi:hypothetical protein
MLPLASHHGGGADPLVRRTNFTAIQMQLERWATILIKVKRNLFDFRAGPPFQSDLAARDWVIRLPKARVDPFKPGFNKVLYQSDLN